MFKHIERSLLDPYERPQIERLSILVKDKNGKIIEIFAENDLCRRLWGTIYRSVHLDLEDWKDEIVEIEKNA